MASRVQVTLVDDLDGGNADESVIFALDGRAYEIDLSTKNAAKLRKALEPYVSAGRRAGRVPRQSPLRRSANGSGTSNAAEIRAWAAENGHQVSSRGRIPGEVLAAYESR